MCFVIVTGKWGRAIGRWEDDGGGVSGNDDNRRDGGFRRGATRGTYLPTKKRSDGFVRNSVSLDKPGILGGIISYKPN